MATLTNAFSTYEAIGIREELHDDISMITPWETPVLSALPSGPCDNTFVEWQTDALAAASTTNYNIEGEDTTITARIPTVRLGNRTQIAKKGYGITGTEERVKKAGRQSEIDYQNMKVGRELLVDNESTLIGLYQAKVTGSTAAARKLGNFSSWIKTNTAGGDTAPATADGTNVPTVVADTVFTETQFNTLVQATWTAGGSPDKFFCPPGFKALISSTFRGRATAVNDDPNRAAIATVVDVIRTDFGTIHIVPCRNMKSNMCLLLDTSKASVLWLRPTFSTPLAKTGDADRWQIINEFTLKIDNEKAHGAVYGSKTA